jgi:hypothetical protein
MYTGDTEYRRGMPTMATAVQVRETQTPTSMKGGVPMMKNDSNVLSLLLSPRVLRMELIGAVVATILFGRLIPTFGRLLREVTTLLFR